MAVNEEKYREIVQELGPGVTLVAVSKTKPIDDILALYALGHRHFGENYVQELADKYAELPADITWHFIGHLQSNKARQVVPVAALIQGVESFKLLKEINKQAEKIGKQVNVLLQVHIAREETKFGLDEAELAIILQPDQLLPLKNVLIKGLMGMASFTADAGVVTGEFNRLQQLYVFYKEKSLPQTDFNTLSMGMSSDYPLAVASGSNMVRIGSLLFGERNKR